MDLLGILGLCYQHIQDINLNPVFQLTVSLSYFVSSRRRLEWRRASGTFPRPLLHRPAGADFRQVLRGLGGIFMLFLPWNLNSPLPPPQKGYGQAWQQLHALPPPPQKETERSGGRSGLVLYLCIQMLAFALVLSKKCGCSQVDNLLLVPLCSCNIATFTTD